MRACVALKPAAVQMCSSINRRHHREVHRGVSRQYRECDGINERTCVNNVAYIRLGISNLFYSAHAVLASRKIEWRRIKIYKLLAAWQCGMAYMKSIAVEAGRH